MSQDVEKAMDDLKSNLSFGGGGGRGGGGRAQTGIGFGVGYSTGGNKKAAPGLGPSFENTGRNPAPSRTWGQDFWNCIRQDSTWHGSQMPATDSVIGCGAKTLSGHW